ncbi:MAG: hotdog fold thioesterase [Acidimicrobiales bacterium]|nr:hotdog fold thioesterase [Acidimicrobiales bacterium]
MTVDEPLDEPVDLPLDPRAHVNAYFRVERWEVPPADPEDGPSAMSGRAPLDDHLRSPAGGLRTGALNTVFDSLGGLMSGLAVQPGWIVTTSLMTTVARLSHTGPLRIDGRILRRGRNAVVAALDAVDEGEGDRPVAAALLTSAVLDPGAMRLEFERPLVMPMPPPHGDRRPPEEFFCIQPGEGPVTRLDLEDRLRNPWGILHGGALAVLADEAACRAVRADGSGRRQVAAPDSVLHYLQPARRGPVEARAEVVGRRNGRALVRIGIHDVGADGRRIMLASVSVTDV